VEENSLQVEKSFLGEAEDIMASNAEWESSFKQVLQRTKQNISLISQRYAQSDIVEFPLRAGSGGVRPTPGVTSYLPTGASQQQQQSSSPSRRQQPRGNLVSIDADTLNMILQRLAKLEERRLEGGETRLAAVEQTVENLRKTTDATVIELQDAQRAALQLGNQITRQSGLLEVLQQDVDARRSVVSRMDSWARQGEIWREDMEAQLVALNRQIKELSRQSKENQSSLSDAPSKFDLDALKTQTTILTQQSVAASLAAWHDKIEGSVRSVERQVAALRLGTTVKGGAGGVAGVELSDEQVAAALVTPMPSELMVKAMVDSAVKSLESSIENTVETRVGQALRATQADSNKELRQEVREAVNRVAAEVGLQTSDGSESAARQAMAQRKAQQRELEGLCTRVDDLSAALIALQEGTEASERAKAADSRALERRVDESCSVANSAVVSIQARCAGLEEMTRTAELATRTALSVAREEAQERLRDAAAALSSDRVSLDRRLVLVERTCEDLTDRLKVSNSAIEAFFVSSQEGRRLQQAAGRAELLTVEVSNIKNDLRDSAAAYAKLEAQSCRRTELIELRERVSTLEPLQEAQRRAEMAARNTAEDVGRLSQDVQRVDQANQLGSTAIKALSDRLRSAEASVGSASETATVASEAQKLATLKLAQLEAALGSKHGSLEARVAELGDAVDRNHASAKTLVVSVVKEQMDLAKRDWGAALASAPPPAPAPAPAPAPTPAASTATASVPPPAVVENLSVAAKKEKETPPPAAPTTPSVSTAASKSSKSGKSAGKAQAGGASSPDLSGINVSNVTRGSSLYDPDFSTGA